MPFRVQVKGKSKPSGLDAEKKKMDQLSFGMQRTVSLPVQADSGLS